MISHLLTNMEQRTPKQNDSLHLYLTMVAHELENQGQTMNDVVKKYDKIEIPATKSSVKEIIWKPIQEATLGKRSTTELTSKEINDVYQIVAGFLAMSFGIDLPFPSQEQTDNYIQSYDISRNHN